MLSILCQNCIDMFELINRDDSICFFFSPFASGCYRGVVQGVHHDSFDSFSSSALSNCAICYKLYHRSSWTNEPARFTLLSFQLDQIRFRHGSQPAWWELCFYEGSLESRDGKELLRFVLDPLSSERDSKVAKYLDCPLTRDNTIKSLKNTGHGKSIELATLWFNDCLTSHARCPSSSKSPAFYPRRLLDLRNSPISLIESDTTRPNGPYATLSHCWGRGPKPLTLSSSNLAKLAQGIDEWDLPQTFRDAVSATLALGVEYLWIDSLCIIQSGAAHKQDWEEHVLKMGEIYENSILNIAASRATCSADGCFTDRDWDLISPCIVPFRGIEDKRSHYNYDDETVTVNRSSASRHKLVLASLQKQNIGRSPLDTRGWVCQERLLASRILHFGSDQLYWECYECLACESDPDGGVPRPAVCFAWKWDDASDQHRGWLLNLIDYSLRELTEPDDKTAAIAGVARKVHTQLGDDYVAGFFKSLLPRTLLWKPRHGMKIWAQRSSKYRAPTWSWISMDGALLFHENYVYIRTGRDLAVVEDIHVDLVEPHNPFGQIKGGFITLKAPIVKLPPLQVDIADRDLTIKVPELSNTSCFIQFDNDPPFLRNPPLFLLLLRDEPSDFSLGDFEEFGLVLANESIDQVDPFVRVGLFFTNPFSKENRKTHSNIQSITIL